MPIEIVKTQRQFNSAEINSSISNSDSAFAMSIEIKNWQNSKSVIVNLLLKFVKIQIWKATSKLSYLYLKL